MGPIFLWIFSVPWSVSRSNIFIEVTTFCFNANHMNFVVVGILFS